MGGGLEGGFAGQGDGGGGQAVAGVGVVGGVALEVGAADAAVIGAAHAVNHGGVGLQAHALVEAVDEYGGHVGAVFFVGGFFFDDAGHGEQLVGVLIRQIAGTVAPGGLQLALHAAVGKAVDLQIAAVVVDFVAVGEEAAFGMLYVGIGGDGGEELAIAPAGGVVADVGGLVDETAHLGKTHAFDDAYGDGVGAAVFEVAQDLPGGSAGLEAVVAGQELFVGAGEVGGGHEHPAAVDGVVGGQRAAHAADAAAALHA